MSSRARVAIVAALFPLVLWAALPLVSSGSTADQVQSEVNGISSREQALKGAIGGLDNRIAGVQGSLDNLDSRIAPIQRDLDAKRAELLRIRGEARAARKRLDILELRLRRSERALASNLTQRYRSDSPDFITVILESRGFADLIERADFYRRVRDEDVRVLADVRHARIAVAALATQLGALEARQQKITEQSLVQRDRLESIRIALVNRRGGLAGARAARRARLAALEARRKGLERRLRRLRPGSFASPGSVASGGGYVFPLPKSAASSPDSWSEDDGVDISAPGHTPLLAIGSGTIVLHGIGGFGDWAPVLHLDSGQCIYYGHAGPGNSVPVGTHVGAGQTIGEVGAGIVGISTGPHLEIGFCGSSGAPIGPSTSSAMHSLLLRAYG